MPRTTVHIEGVPALEGLDFDDPAAAVAALFATPEGLAARIVRGPAPRPRAHRITLVGGEVELPISEEVAKGRAPAPRDRRTITVALEAAALDDARAAARSRGAAVRTGERVVSVLGVNFRVYVLTEFEEPDAAP